MAARTLLATAAGGASYRIPGRACPGSKAGRRAGRTLATLDRAEAGAIAVLTGVVTAGEVCFQLLRAAGGPGRALWYPASSLRDGVVADPADPGGAATEGIEQVLVGRPQVHAEEPGGDDEEGVVGAS